MKNKIIRYFNINTEHKILRIILKKEFLDILTNEYDIQIYKEKKLDIKNITDFIIKNLITNKNLNKICHISLILPKETLYHFFHNYIYIINLETSFLTNELYIEFPENIQNKLKINFSKNKLNEFYLQTNNIKNIEIPLKNTKINKLKLTENKKYKNSFNNQLNLENIENEIILEDICEYKIILNENIKKLSLYETNNLNIKTKKIKYLSELNYIKHIIIEEDVEFLLKLIKKIKEINQFSLNSYLGIKYNKPQIDNLINLLMKKNLKILDIYNLKFNGNINIIENIKILKLHKMNINTTIYIKNIEELLLDNNNLNNNLCFLENIRKCNIYLKSLKELKYYKFKKLINLNIGTYINDLIKLKELFENIYNHIKNFDKIKHFEIQNFDIEKQNKILKQVLIIINNFLTSRDNHKFKEEVLNLYISNIKNTSKEVIPFFIFKEYYKIINKKIIVYKV